MCLEATLEQARTGARQAAVPDHGGARTKELPRIGRRAFLKTGAAAGAVAGLGATGAGAVLATPALASQVPGRRTVDLSHVFRAGFPVYTGPVPQRVVRKTIAADGFYTQEWTFWEHSATHMDAPGHFAAGGRLSPDITPEELLLPAVVIDIAARAAVDPDAQVTVADLRGFERGNGRILRGSAVLMHSGWETRAGDPDAFQNVGPDGLFHFPGFSVDAVEWLLENRDIRAIGVDTLSLDFGPSQTFGVHHLLLGADRYGLENLRGLTAIPPRGATIFVGLIPWEAGSGGPCRVIARW